jgi:hypothetical protein
MFIIRDKRSWMSFLFRLGFLQSGKLGFGEHQPVLGALGLQCIDAFIRSISRRVRKRMNASKDALATY